ncbi:MAG: ABC transporter permease [Defluviitaleaceae bacterium]|nr:ABC transporter permease [Defluviitaleaceae bacterium]
MSNVETTKKVKQRNETSFLHIVAREVYADKIALVSFILMVGIIFTTFIWAATLDNDFAVRINLSLANQAPSDDFLLGTDPGGRAITDMLVLGARNSLLIAFAVTAITGLAGLLMGLFAGFYGGHVDNVLMRIIDTFTMMPTLMFIIVFVSIVPNYSVPEFVFIMSVFGWMGMARTIRARTLQQGRLDYVSASKTLGTPNLVVIFREVLPNLVSIVTVAFTLALAGNIGLETGLTFLGFGMPANTPSLGTLISYAATPAFMVNRPWQWLPAALFVLILTLCVNFVGQAFNRAADARQRLV